LTIAHQYIAQLTESIRKTAFGNIGSIICFRIGSEDAYVLAREFAPQFEPEDLISLDSRQSCVKLSIDGMTSEPFSSVTIQIPKPKETYDQQIIEFSRRQYAVPKSEVEKALFRDNKETMTHIAGEEGYSGEEVDDSFEEPLIN